MYVILYLFVYCIIIQMIYASNIAIAQLVCVLYTLCILFTEILFSFSYQSYNSNGLFILNQFYHYVDFRSPANSIAIWISMLCFFSIAHSIFHNIIAIIGNNKKTTGEFTVFIVNNITYVMYTLEML